MIFTRQVYFSKSDKVVSGGNINLNLSTIYICTIFRKLFNSLLVFNMYKLIQTASPTCNLSLSFVFIPLRFSVSNDLKFDAQRDLKDIGASNIPVHSLNKVSNISKCFFFQETDKEVNKNHGGNILDLLFCVYHLLFLHMTDPISPSHVLISAFMLDMHPLGNI